MNRILQTISLVLLILLMISLAGNFIQYKTCKRKPIESEITYVTKSDTIRDTVYVPERSSFTVVNPKPAYVDTAANIKTYRDTIYLQYGSISREETVFGDLLRKDLKLDLNIPEFTNTVTVTNTITRTVKSPLLFVTGGFRTSYQMENSVRSPDILIVPSIGLYGISEGHKWSAGVDFGFDRQLTIKIGFRISR